MPWSCAAGMKWVPISPLVDQPQIQKVMNRIQNTRVRALSRSVREGEPGGAAGSRSARPAASSRPGRRTAWCRRRPAGRAAAEDQRHEQQREECDQPGRPAPTRPVGQVCDRRQEDQLAGRAGRREDTDHDAAVAHEPAVGHDGAEDQGQRAGADADREAPQQPQLPGRGHHQGQPRADCDQDERGRDDPAEAEPLHQCRRERRREPVDDQVEADRPARGGAGPAEVLLERLEQGAGAGPEPGGGDQRAHRDQRDEPGAVQPPGARPAFHGGCHRTSLWGTVTVMTDPASALGLHRPGRVRAAVPRRGGDGRGRPTGWC